MKPAYLMVKDYRRFQHYRDRHPAWIKLYNALLDNDEFLALPDATRGHLILIWLLASRRDNKIPNDPKLVARALQATGRVDLERLVSAGFLIPYQSASAHGSEPLVDAEQSASTDASETGALRSGRVRPRARVEGEKETEGEERQRRERSETARAGEAHQVRAALDATTLALLDALPEQFGEHWTEADRFLRSRAAHTWPAWAREFAKLIGPGSHFVAADVGQALADALALEQPIGGPMPLRIFVERARKTRLEREQRDAQDNRRRESGTPSITEATAKHDAALVAQDEAEGNARAATAEQWRAAHPEEAAEIDRALATQFPGEGPFVAMTRASAFVSRVADRAQRKAS